jgi:hypothetical protein
MLAMGIKTVAKRLLGRALSIDFIEKLAEYTINEGDSPAALNGAADFTPEGRTWNEIVERGRRAIWRETVPANDNILLLEFGVWEGASIRAFAEINHAPGSLFYGFDSFEGLPEYWRGMEAGRFSTGGEAPKVTDPRVRFVKGWFQDSLPPLIDELAAAAEGRTVIVHFDADLYSSTLFLLFTLAPRLKRFRFIFDEYAGHEARAMYNFLQASGAAAHFSHRCDWQGYPTIASGEVKDHCFLTAAR